jgi:hypothetical protein
MPCHQELGVLTRPRFVLGALTRPRSPGPGDYFFETRGPHERKG